MESWGDRHRRRLRRRLRHLRRDIRMWRDVAHPAIGYTAFAAIILATAGLVAYALTTVVAGFVVALAAAWTVGRLAERRSRL